MSREQITKEENHQKGDTFFAILTFSFFSLHY